MRNLIPGLLLVSAYSAAASDIATCQFIGKVKNHYDVQTSENSSECFFGIEFNPGWPNAECLISREELAGVEFRDKRCLLNNGVQVSGVIAKNGSYIYIE
jgi:hypothetical protein